MVTVGLFIRVEAKPDKVAEVEATLKSVVDLVRKERKAVVWFALRLGPTKFAIYDAFANDADRQAHLEVNGPALRSLMRTAHVDDIDIRYELTGQDEPLLPVHGSNIATGLRPLAAALGGRAPSLSLVRYHRRGMGGSSGRGGPISVEQQAADALGLLDALGLPSAHILGCSYGATVAIEAALAAPDRTRSLLLLEPVRKGVPSSGRFFGGMEPVMRLYAAGDMVGAVTATFAGLGGQHWQDLVATAGPDAFDMAVRDTEIFYRTEAPSLDTWTFSPGTRRRGERSRAVGAGNQQRTVLQRRPTTSASAFPAVRGRQHPRRQP